MISTKPRLVSGIKPTGRIHIGNYFGAMKQFVDLQDTYDAYIFIANLHALTGTPTKEQLISDTRDIILDYLAVGLDPQKATIFRQSDLPAHANLAWIFNCLVTVPYLERAHAFKDAQAKAHEVNAGTFTYPVLMAADILLYDADIVPVGKDQKQHIEYARDIALKFNHLYGEHFKLPKELIQDAVATVPGTDGQKMSKSYNNTIPLFASDEEIKKAVMSIPTDSKGVEDEKNPDDMILYQMHKLFDDSAALKARYTKGMGYKEAKDLLIADIISFVTPLREKRKMYEHDPNLVREILLQGALKANEVAMKKLQEVYEAIGLTE